MTNLVFPTHATETLEATLGNATKAAENVETIRYKLGNITAVASSVNTGFKAASLGYGVAITGASAIDAFYGGNTCSRLLFAAGGVCGAAGTVSNGIAVFNI